MQKSKKILLYQGPSKEKSTKKCTVFFMKYFSEDYHYLGIFFNVEEITFSFDPNQMSVF